MHRHLFFLGIEEGSRLIERRRGCSFIEACKTSNIGLAIYIFPFSVSTSWMSLSTQSRKLSTSMGLPSVDTSSWLDQNSPCRWLVFSIKTSSAMVITKHREDKHKIDQLLQRHKSLHISATYSFKNQNEVDGSTYFRKK